MALNPNTANAGALTDLDHNLDKRIDNLPHGGAVVEVRRCELP